MSDWELGLLDSSSLKLLGGVVVVLVVATVIAWLLGRRLGPMSTIVNLKQRINAWWLMVALIGAVLAAGETVTIVLFLLLSLLALREFITISPTGRGDHKVLVWLVFIIPAVHYWFLWEHWYGMFSVFIPVYAFLFLPTRNALAGQTAGFLQRTAAIQWALMVCVYALSYAPALLQLPLAMEAGRDAAEGSAPGTGGATGAHLLLFLLIVVQGSDVLQYVWGKTLGRHPIAPSVSPNKTWEGFIGGVLSATALGAALWWITPFNPLMAALLALISCVMGFAGGLVMSAIKRDRGIKDFGSTIPGHGGIMDRLDSLCFAAPVFFHAVRFFYT
ncbi:phosphatidate cytidylyltransferase [Arthrobacter gengyunqii]|uniref:Phosphatidate cytidylyltransferase n=1 Tax=Arthrobacter gengyunqii TaxID=2886940 RepID=A0A9X1M4Y3_9MICC|nr:phosphatidate cytidylyltransferase [Arthrobacter gengyunqii]MCC3270980.1 phosphatidate cytidylyltransferase [Arthrobacter gengyunqii]UOY96530.1 phosphatidate cytidylyltransferase [Arthrobacter gengyunqii]